MYNKQMKPILTVLILVHALSGCAVMTVVNSVSAVSTGKTVTDHTASLVTQKDCNAWRASIDMTYYCEYLHDAGTRYNRNPY